LIAPDPAFAGIVDRERLRLVVLGCFAMVNRPSGRLNVIDFSSLENVQMRCPQTMIARVDLPTNAVYSK
jgi:hypothetical protein